MERFPTGWKTFAAVGLLLMWPTVSAALTISHFGSTNPETEGWIHAMSGDVASVGPGSEGGADYWDIQSGNEPSYNFYCIYPAAATYNDPAGWTLTVTMRLTTSSYFWDSGLIVADNSHWWTLSILGPNAPEGNGPGAWTVNSNWSHNHIWDGDPTLAYHTYQIIYDPVTDSAAYYVDGNAIGTQARAVAPVHQTGYVLWGDYQAWNAGAGPTNSHVSFARFETGQHIYSSPPPLITNDTCATATPVSGLDAVNAATTGAASEGTTASCGNSNASPDVWYSFAALRSGTLHLNTCGSAIDTVLSVYSSCGGTELACNDNSDDCGAASLQSSLSLPVAQGQTYKIRVAGNNGATGSFILNTGFCLDAQTITTGTTTGTTVGAGLDAAVACAPNSPSVWYRFSAAQSGWLKLDASSAAFPAVLSLFSDACPLGSELACGGTTLFHQVAEGTTYLVRVASGDQTTGTFNLNVSYFCPTAQSIALGTTAGTTVGAAADAASACGTGVPAAWYRYTAGQTGWLKADATDATFPATISFFADACPVGTELTCGGSVYAIPATQGTAYLIRVATADATTGTFHLKLSYDTVLFTHEGRKDPVTEGWTLDRLGADGANDVFVTEPGTENGTDYWRAANSNPVDPQCSATSGYYLNLTPAMISDPAGWTATVTLRNVQSLGFWEPGLLMTDSSNWWMLSINGPGGLDPNAPMGLYGSNSDWTHPQFWAGNPAADYHTYQIIFDPAGNGGGGAVTYYVDGAAVGAQARDTAPPPDSGPRVYWGDWQLWSAPGSTGTDVHYAFAQFEIGQHVKMPCHTPFADADGDGDVDQDDFGAFQQCFTGSSPAGAPVGSCRCFDRENFPTGDGDVDAADLTAFMNCVTGPNVRYADHPVIGCNP